MRVSSVHRRLPVQSGSPSPDKPVDTRSDIYSLGVTLWYLLTGRTPFVGRTMEEIRARQTGELPLEQLKGLHIPGKVVALLKSMLATDPDDRPQAARELLLAVHSCYDRFNPEARRRRRKAILVNVALALAIVAIALGDGCINDCGHLRPRSGQSPCCHSRISAATKRTLTLPREYRMKS